MLLRIKDGQPLLNIVESDACIRIVNSLLLIVADAVLAGKMDGIGRYRKPDVYKSV